jgi:adenosylcobinamide-GDP ribazoletransferase
VIAGLTALAAAWFLEGVKGLAFVLAAALWSMAVARWAQARFGGVTGDILGAHLEVAETLLFLAAAVLSQG